MKPLRFIGSSKDDLSAFPPRGAPSGWHGVVAGAKRSDAQRFKPMLTIGAGVYEIRVQVLGEWRVLYVAKFAPAIYVLHAFQMKTPKTAKADIDLAIKRYKLIGA